MLSCLLRTLAGSARALLDHVSYILGATLAIWRGFSHPSTPPHTRTHHPSSSSMVIHGLPIMHLTQRAILCFVLLRCSSSLFFFFFVYTAFVVPQEQQHLCTSSCDTRTKQIINQYENKYYLRTRSICHGIFFKMNNNSTTRKPRRKATS